MWLCSASMQRLVLCSAQTNFSTKQPIDLPINQPIDLSFHPQSSNQQFTQWLKHEPASCYKQASKQPSKQGHRHTDTDTQTPRHTDTHTHIHIHMRIHIHIHIHARSHMRTDTHTQTPTPTHTHTWHINSPTNDLISYAVVSQLQYFERQLNQPITQFSLASHSIRMWTNQPLEATS